MHNDLPTARQSLYDDMQKLHLAPLWASLHALVPKEPAPPYVPALWRYKDILPHLQRAGQLISAEEAVRRVLILENPALPGRASITQSLYAGLQLILPGEIARAHRHTQAALRFIVSGKGAYTAVNGERTTVHPGDFIITPSWTWHDHGNSGLDGHSEAVVWLDGLDIPILRFLDAGFAENSERTSQYLKRPEGQSFAFYGNNMAPVRTSHMSLSSPVFNYPYARTREALETLRRTKAIDVWHGVKLRYINPLTGGSPMPTIGACMQLLPAGFNGKRHRSTDGTVYNVVEGNGSVTIGDTCFSFAQHDTFVVPSWATVSFEAPEDVVLFSFSDYPVQQALGLLREERLSN